MKATRNFEKIVEPLDKAGIRYVEFGGNTVPDISAVLDGTALCRNHKADVVIGVGGGCCMDLAKAIGRCVKFDKNAADCLGDESVVASNESLPVIEIITNLSSGSEYDQWCDIKEKTMTPGLAL